MNSPISPKTPQKPARLLFLFTAVLSIVFVVVFLFSLISPSKAEAWQVPVMMQSQLLADYGEDAFYFELPVYGMDLVQQVMLDEGADGISERFGALEANLNLPVPSITPQWQGDTQNPLPGTNDSPQPQLPTPTKEAQLDRMDGITSTVTNTPSSTATNTALPTATVTKTQVVYTRTPTATQNPPMINTPTTTHTPEPTLTPTVTLTPIPLPDAAVLVFPVGNIATNAYPVFIWQPGAWAGSYLFELGNIDGMILSIILSADDLGCADAGQTCNYSPLLMMQMGTVYHWTITALNATGSSAQSSVFEFWLANPEVTPRSSGLTLISPLDFSGVDHQGTNFKWYAIPGAIQYKFVLKTASETHAIILKAEDACEEGVCSIDWMTTIDSGFYEWQVNALGVSGRQVASATWHVQVTTNQP